MASKSGSSSGSFVSKGALINENTTARKARAPGQPPKIRIILMFIYTNNKKYCKIVKNGKFI